MTDSLDNQSTSEKSGSNLEKKKLLTVLLSLGNSVHVEVVNEEFKNIVNENERKQVISDLIVKAGETSIREAKNFASTDWKNIKVPINDGSLYDDLIFESAIYIDNKNQMHVSTSFGKKIDPRTPLTEGLQLVGEVLEATSGHFKPEIVDEPQSTLPIPEGFNRRF